MRIVRYIAPGASPKSGYASVDVYVHHGRSLVTGGHILENAETGSVIVFNGTVEDVPDDELKRVLSHSAMYRISSR